MIFHDIRSNKKLQSMDSFDDSREMYSHTTRIGDISLSGQLLSGFEKLRISALTKAAEMSPYVKEVTIGPRSPLKKEEIKENVSDTNKINNEPTENLIEDKLQNDLRYTIIMKEYQNRIHETSDAIYKNLVEKMIARRADTMQRYWAKQHEECERKAMELRVKKLQLLKELQDNDLTVLQHAKTVEQNNQLINKQTLENMNKILEEQNMATTRFAAVTDSHTKTCIYYNEITNLIQTEPLAKQICNKYITVLNDWMVSINVIMESCKTGTINERNVKQAELLVANVENIKHKILDEINQLKKEEIARQQAEEQEKAKLKEIEDKKAAEAQLEEVKAQTTQLNQPTFYSAKNYNYFEELRNYLATYESQYQELLNNISLKKFRFDCQKAVNTPVNALSSVSGSHMRDKYDKLSKLLKGERVQVLDTVVNASQHPQGLQYCSALLAKKIVRQGELLVSSNPEAAFPLAAVTVALWSQFPDFGKLLEAYFHKFCPYLVPMFLPQKEGQTDKEFYLSRGYTYNEDGVVEKQDKFLKRISGIFQLRCAIWIANVPRFLNQPNPHGLKFGWQWLASFINLKPEPDICATLLNDFFTICGNECFKCYGKQFTKIIGVITTDYIAILENIDEGGPKTRFEVFLQNVLKTGSIPVPTGSLPLNTW